MNTSRDERGETAVGGPAEGRPPRTAYRKFTVRPAQLADEYDVVVIGAGVGGLTCGGYLAKSGARVLIVERHSVPGGLCSFFRRGGFYFDAGAHYFGGLGNRWSFVSRLLKGLDLDVEFIQLDPVDIIHFPGATIELPADIEAHVEMLRRVFPHEGESVAAFFKELLHVYRHFFRGMQESEVLSRYRETTYRELLDRFFRDENLKTVLSATVGYIGTNPARVSAIAMAAMMMSYFHDGGFIARGGSQSLPDGIMRRFSAEGGHLLLNTAVERIIVEGGRAAGVLLSTGQEVRSRVLVSNADPLQTFRKLVGEGRADPDYLQQVENCRESNSCFVVYLGLDCGDEELRGKRGWHFDYHGPPSADAAPLYIATPTLEDKTLCPPGCNILTATTLYAEPPVLRERWPDPGWWAGYKQDCERLTLDRLERIVPGISRRIVVKESATQRTIHRYTLNSKGAMYGWESSPDQFWLNRLSYKTPLENLFLCGHWASTGPGVISVISCGFLVAREVAQALRQSTDAPPAHQVL